MASTAKAYIHDMLLQDGWMQYYGDFYKNEVGYYMIALSDGPISSTGLPTRVGDKALHLFIGDRVPLDGDHAQLTPGVYPISDSHEIGVADAYNCKFVISTEVENNVTTKGYTYRFVDGTITVEHIGERAYSFLIEGKIEEEKGEINIRCRFDGELPFSNIDPARYTPPSKDITMVPHNFSGTYSSSSTGQYGTYSFTLYNTPVDQYGFISGAGEVMGLTLLAPYSAKMDINKLVGVYDLFVESKAGSTYTPPAIIAGMYKYSYGIYMPQGSYYSRYNENMQLDLLGLFTKEQISITQEGEMIKLVGEMITIQNKRVKIDYTGPISNLIDYSQNSASQLQFTESNVHSINSLRAIPHQQLNQLFISK